MKAAHSGGCGERVQVRHLLGRFDQAAGLRHGRGAAHGEGGLVRPAALARPESGRFSFLAARVEADIFAPRGARGARGAAIDAGGPHE